MKKNIKKQSVVSGLVALWYKPVLSFLLWPLVPFSVLVKTIAQSRYRRGRLSQRTSLACNIPVVIVGNITVGGSGKTPLVVTLVAYLKSKGWSPAIISRGYGAQCKAFPARVYPGSDPVLYGDEPVMLAQMAQVPLVIAPNRPQAAKMVSELTECDIIISDDGLQHYPLERNIEVVVMDGERGLGNGYCLPAGPLREDVSRLNTVDLIVSKGILASELNVKVHQMTLISGKVENIVSGDRLTLSEFVNRYQQVHAVAGIGHPGLFFNALRKAGLKVIEHSFPDHHPYQLSEVMFDDEWPVLMTVKDAVKCRQFDRDNLWCLPVEGVMDQAFWSAFDLLIESQCVVDK